jgi:iron complex transport system permease protein
MIASLAHTARERKNAVIIAGFGLALVIATLLSLSIGAVSIPVADILILLFKKIGLYSSQQVDEMHTIVLASIRLPRILMTVLIGGALGISGAALQGLFRNPLVEPGLIGVSGGSAAAVVTLIVFGGTWSLPTEGLIHNSLLPIVAFVGGVAATFIVLRLSNQSGSTNIAVLILIGVAINALAGAIIGLAIFYADENQLRTFTFWTLGDLGGATWDKLVIAAPLLAFASVSLLFFSRSLNAFALGEAEAFHMGVDVERTKMTIIFLSALAVGVSVSMVGMIGFIGLVVPHLIRVLFQPDHRLVLPASVLGGAILLVISDLISRTIVAPAELPIGVVTALIGAPFFIGLLTNAKKKQEI